LAAYLVPVAYLGVIFAVAIHEIIGHGLTAFCLGGSFRGFILKWDGMGWASAAPAIGAPGWHQTVILAAGVVATTVCGIALLLGAWLWRKRFFLRMAMLILATNCLLEGPPYVLWNAYHPVAPGDIGRILMMGSDGLRPILMLIGGLLTVASTAVLSALVFQGVEEWLGTGTRLEGRSRFIALLVFLALPGVAGSFAFDWNQLAPGIGWFPCIAQAAAFVLMACLLYKRSFVPATEGPPITASRMPIAFAWLVTLILLLAMWLYLGKGMYWA
jgi:hypothetical protein